MRAVPHGTQPNTSYTSGCDSRYMPVSSGRSLPVTLTDALIPSCSCLQFAAGVRVYRRVLLCDGKCCPDGSGNTQFFCFLFGCLFFLSFLFFVFFWLSFFF